MADPASVLTPLGVPQNVKADAWDAFNSAKDQQDFQKRFEALQIPQEAKAALWDMKYAAPASNGPAVDPSDAALQKMLQQQGTPTPGVMDFLMNTAGTIGSDWMNAPSALYNTIRHPIDTLSQMATPPHEQIPESQLPQDAFHRWQRKLGGGPNNLPPDTTPNSEVLGHALSMLPLVAAPEILGAANKAAPTVATFTKAAASAGGPDVAVGTMKLGAGAALDQFGAPYHIGTVLGVREGAPQIGLGLMKGFKAGRAALAQPEMPEPPSASASSPAAGPTAPPAPSTPAPPPTGVDPNVWSQMTPEMQEAIYKGAATAAARRGTPAPSPMPEPPGGLPNTEAYKASVPQVSIVPEGEHNIIRKVAETNRGAKDTAIARSLKDEGFTAQTLDQMSDADLAKRVKGLGYRPSTGKNYSRTWSAFRRDLRSLLD